MPTDAVPPRRAFRDDPELPPYRGEGASMQLRAYEGWQADAYWLVFTCAGEYGCQRSIELGIRPAIARFGRNMTIRGIAARLRCLGCGGRKIVTQVAADCRGASSREDEGPAPETRADFSSRS
jgi:hypothetical protein